jgi:hypothetical protein
MPCQRIILAECDCIDVRGGGAGLLHGLLEEHQREIQPMMDQLKVWKALKGEYYAVHMFRDLAHVADALKYMRVSVPFVASMPDATILFRYWLLPPCVYCLPIQCAVMGPGLQHACTAWATGQRCRGFQSMRCTRRCGSMWCLVRGPQLYAVGPQCQV